MMNLPERCPHCELSLGEHPESYEDTLELTFRMPALAFATRSDDGDISAYEDLEPDWGNEELTKVECRSCGALLWSDDDNDAYTIRVPRRDLETFRFAAMGAAGRLITFAAYPGATRYRLLGVGEKLRLERHSPDTLNTEPFEAALQPFIVLPEPEA